MFQDFIKNNPRLVAYAIFFLLVAIYCAVAWVYSPKLYENWPLVLIFLVVAFLGVQRSLRSK